MTRTEIEAQVASYLNRSDLTSSIAFWFNIAHREAQRLRNFKFMEATAYELFITDVDQYSVPTDLKEPYSTYAFDATTGGVISFYHQVDIASVRDARHQRDIAPIAFIDASLAVGWDTRMLFAIWGNVIEVYPKPGSALASKRLQMDYYRFVSPPGEGCEDWLTMWGFDYLLYRALMEAIPFLDSTDQRIQVWSAQMLRAQTALIGVDVSATWASDSLAMRG